MKFVRVVYIDQKVVTKNFKDVALKMFEFTIKTCFINLYILCTFINLIREIKQVPIFGIILS